LVMGTCFSITLLRVSVKVLSEVLNSGMLCKVCETGSLASSAFAVLVRACQSTARQLYCRWVWFRRGRY